MCDPGTRKIARRAGTYPSTPLTHAFPERPRQRAYPGSLRADGRHLVAARLGKDPGSRADLPSTFRFASVAALGRERGCESDASSQSREFHHRGGPVGNTRPFASIFSAAMNASCASRHLPQRLFGKQRVEIAGAVNDSQYLHDFVARPIDDQIFAVHDHPYVGTPLRARRTRPGEQCSLLCAFAHFPYK